VKDNVREGQGRRGSGLLVKSARLPGRRYGAILILAGIDKSKRQTCEAMVQHSRQRGDGF
jgi:hypothetical protein